MRRAWRLISFQASLPQIESTKCANAKQKWWFGRHHLTTEVGIVTRKEFHQLRERRPPKSQDGGSQSENAMHVATPKRTLKDVKWVQKHMKLPPPREYPLAPPTLFTIPWGWRSYMETNMGLRFEPFQYKSSSGSFEYGLKCVFHDEERPIVVVGSHHTSKGAQRAAHLMLVSELHTSGFFRKIFTSSESVLLSREEFSAAGDSTIDVYNYAARFDVLPQFSEPTTHMILRHGKGGFHKIFRTKVSLPLHGIEGVGNGASPSEAQTAACVDFKRQAENYVANSPPDDLVLQEAEAINANNAKNFVEFYKSIYKTTKVDSVVSPFDSGGIWKASVKLNGIELDSVVLTGKKRAQEVAYLPAALVLKRSNPSLLPRFFKALEAGDDNILPTVPPIPLHLSGECLDSVVNTMFKAREAGLPDAKELITADIRTEDEVNCNYLMRPEPAEEEEDRRSKALSKWLKSYEEDPELAELRTRRKDLPISNYFGQITDMVSNHTYSIIVGDTGSGKSTQVPQILLNEATKRGEGGRCNIVCTQPRRIAATSLARRVAGERNERLRQAVGYHVRFDAQLPSSAGSIIYCTTGILLQQLRYKPDDVFDRNTHIVIDEVHERDVLIDFLLVLLKRSIAHRAAAGKSTPKVVLMSATADPKLFAAYFSPTRGEEGESTECPVLRVPGRSFPIKHTYLPELLQDLEKKYPLEILKPLSLDKDTEEFLEIEKDFQSKRGASDGSEGSGTPSIDWAKAKIAGSANKEALLTDERQDSLMPVPLIATTVAHISHISTDGAVLVFLPGMEEILKVEDYLLKEKPLGVNFEDETKFRLVKVHSLLPEGQAEVFEPTLPPCRKIILTTNIAETSITIPDVRYVIDTGKLREKRYDQARRITRFQCTWISKSNAAQRAGRAGRVQDGNYFALFSRDRYETMRVIGLPEILRSDLQQLCLNVKAQALQTDISQFLSETIEPPNQAHVSTAVKTLQGLEALTQEEELTSLGRLLASLPVHPSLGKMVILGIVFRCLDPMIVIGASSSMKSLFQRPIGLGEEVARIIKSFAAGESSDFVALYNAFNTYRYLAVDKGNYAANMFARDNLIRIGTYRSIVAVARQIEDVLVDAKLIPPNTQGDSSHFITHPSLNTNASNFALIKCLVLAGHHPNLGVSKPGSRAIRTPGEKTGLIHPASVNYQRKLEKDDEETPVRRLVAYGSLSRSSNGGLYLRDTSFSTPLMACLFGGRLQTRRRSLIVMDSWLPFEVGHSDSYDKGEAVKILIEMKKALDRMLSGAFQEITRIKHRDSAVSEDEDEMIQDGETQYLADAGPRKAFADGLVKILHSDSTSLKPEPK